MYDYMLIDTRNCLYRSVYAGLADKRFIDSQADYSVIFFRFMNSYINKFKPKNVLFFWDSPKSTVWRKAIYPEYKAGRIARNENIDEILSRQTNIMNDLIPFINCKNVTKANQEADDLIYAFCHTMPNVKSLIVSSDNDFKQICYRYNNIDLYNPLSKSDEDLYQRDEECDPVELKCFMGEDGDNIQGYDKVGPVTALKIVKDFNLRKKFFETHGKEIYILNKKLVDLSLCPHLQDNIMYVHDVMAADSTFKMNEIMNIISKYKIKGLMGEIKKTILSFKFLGKYKIEVNNGDINPCGTTRFVANQ